MNLIEAVKALSREQLEAYVMHAWGMAIGGLQASDQQMKKIPSSIEKQEDAQLLMKCIEQIKVISTISYPFLSIDDGMANYIKEVFDGAALAFPHYKEIITSLKSCDCPGCELLKKSNKDIQ